SVDGAVVATHGLSVAAGLHPLASDLDPGGGVLSVRSIELVASVEQVDFASAPALPEDWFASPWSSDGAATLGGGLALDGARAGTSAAYGAGLSLEFEATFSGDAWQHGGFG